MRCFSVAVHCGRVSGVELLTFPAAQERAQKYCAEHELLVEDYLWFDSADAPACDWVTTGLASVHIDFGSGYIVGHELDRIQYAKWKRDDYCLTYVAIGGGLVLLSYGVPDDDQGDRHLERYVASDVLPPFASYYGRFDHEVLDHLNILAES